MSHILINDDNITAAKHWKGKLADLIYADMIYEDLNLTWISAYWYLLKSGGHFIIQTDYHSVAEVKVFLDTQFTNAKFLNWLVWKAEFGNFKKDRFRQCHDDILIYYKDGSGMPLTFHSERIQVPKATAKSKGLNPSGRDTKIATSVITDICLTTVAKERIKNKDGRNIRWQKPLALMDRLLSPFTEEGDLIVEPFGGTFSAGRWAIRNNRNYVGIELDKDVFDIGKRAMEEDAKGL